MRQAGRCASRTHSHNSTGPSRRVPEPAWRLVPRHARPGTYTTRTFSPAITYTVPPAGRTAKTSPATSCSSSTATRATSASTATRTPRSSARSIPIPTSAKRCRTTRAGCAGTRCCTSPRRVAVSIGGLRGVYVDISKAPGTQGKGCTFERARRRRPVHRRRPRPGQPAPRDPGPPGFEERLYLLRYRRGNVAIEIGPEGAPLAAYLQEVMPILRSTGSSDVAEPSVERVATNALSGTSPSSDMS